MRTSFLSSRVAGNIVRVFRHIVPAALFLGAACIPAQQGSFAGEWRGAINGIAMTIVIQPNGQFVMTEQSRTLMTQQMGPWRLAAPNTIIFSVANWSPKTMPVYHPTGTVGGYYTQEPMAKPPDGFYTYVFTGPNTLALTDSVMHSTITMTRVH